MGATSIICIAECRRDLSRDIPRLGHVSSLRRTSRAWVEGSANGQGKGSGPGHVDIPRGRFSMAIGFPKCKSWLGRLGLGRRMSLSLSLHQLPDGGHGQQTRR